MSIEYAFMVVGVASEIQELMNNFNFMQSFPPTDFHFSLLVDLHLGTILLIPSPVFISRRGDQRQTVRSGAGDFASKEDD
jgi:hypothetical protein